MSPKIPWQTLGSKEIYKNHWIRLREDKVINPSGKKSIYSVVETKDSVYVVPITEKNEVYLIYAYRYPTKVWSWEIVAGGSESKNLLSEAKRELKEETGLTAKQWTKAGKLQPFNGIISEWAHIYIAKELKQTDKNKQKEEGIIKIKKVPFSKALKMIKTGKITDALCIASLTVVALKLGYIKS